MLSCKPRHAQMIGNIASAILLTTALVGPVSLGDQPALNRDAADYVAGGLITLNDNGAWSWFMDERAIVDRGRLVVGSVRAVKNYDTGKDDPNWGNVEVAVHDLASGETKTVVLHRHFEQDDHDTPAFLALPDGRYVCVYTKHGVELKVYCHHSAPNDPLMWGNPRIFSSPGQAERFGGDSVTYSNLFRFSSGRIFNFYRGVGHDPNYMYSDDNGQSWTYGGRVMKGRDGYSPYLKYVQDGDVIHFVTTEDHPRNYDNSLYHGFLRDGQLCKSDGSVVAELSANERTNVRTWDFTRIFLGDPDNVAWMTDVELDSKQRPVVLFSVQKDGRGLPPRQGGNDLRYHYARWNGHRWQQTEIAHAGTRLYPFEDDYTGLAAIHPSDPTTVYISTNADPVTGTPLISHADQKRHYELFGGKSDDGGQTWRWTPITANSTKDNLRPIVPKWQDDRTAIVWMRGRYNHNHGEWTTAVVATILPDTK
ncbi:MAG: BNR-4 repeat-containing protein [Planctomycetales bacterium]|nr:BNR-4 repeat-containing protein [Planctomycetales bacterium]